MKIGVSKIWFIYRIINKINCKVYIGQATNISKRWTDHRRAVKLNRPTQTIHYAMIKYGLENFEFEVIASCKSQDNANDLETLLVEQYESYVSTGKGYNATLGGMNAPKSEEWKQDLKDWWHDPSNKEKTKNILLNMQKASTEMMRSENNPFLGIKKTDEHKIKISNSLKGHEVSEESRTKMSNSHKGKPNWRKGKTKFPLDNIKYDHENGKSKQEICATYNIPLNTLSWYITKWNKYR